MFSLRKNDGFQRAGSDLLNFTVLRSIRKDPGVAKGPGTLYEGRKFNAVTMRGIFCFSSDWDLLRLSFSRASQPQIPCVYASVFCKVVGGLKGVGPGMLSMA